MSRKKIRECDSKHLLKKHLKRLAGIDLQILSAQVTEDALHGSESGKAISFYILDALVSIDQDKFFLSQLQSRGILRS